MTPRDDIRRLEEEIAHLLRLKRALQHLAEAEDEVVHADLGLGLEAEAGQMQDIEADHLDKAANLAHVVAELKLKEAELIEKLQQAG